MEDILTTEFRRQVGEYVNQTYYAQKSFRLFKGNKPVAVLVPVTTLERLAELEAFYEETIQARQAVEADQESVSIGPADS